MLVAPKFLQNLEDTLQLFSRRRYIGFQNGVWDLEVSNLVCISGRLTLTFSWGDVSARRLWIVDRANRKFMRISCVFIKAEPGAIFIHVRKYP